jgi:hypothetical protein
MYIFSSQSGEACKYVGRFQATSCFSAGVIGPPKIVQPPGPFFSAKNTVRNVSVSDLLVQSTYLLNAI